MRVGEKARVTETVCGRQGMWPGRAFAPNTEGSGLVLKFRLRAFAQTTKGSGSGSGLNERACAPSRTGGAPGISTRTVVPSSSVVSSTSKA
eukprot:scaffold15416_cov106-Isochrysis_galbana.AAC.1